MARLNKEARPKRRGRAPRLLLFLVSGAMTILNLVSPGSLIQSARAQDSCPTDPPPDGGGGGGGDEVPYTPTCWDVWDCTSWYDWSGSGWRYSGTSCWYSGTICY
jgi:hypothetical protein